MRIYKDVKKLLPIVDEKNDNGQYGYDILTLNRMAELSGMLMEDANDGDFEKSQVPFIVDMEHSLKEMKSTLLIKVSVILRYIYFSVLCKKMSSKMLYLEVQSN